MAESLLRIYRRSEMSPADLQGILHRESAHDLSANELVAGILKKVESVGTAAVLEYTRQFDHIDLDQLMASPVEFDQAEQQLSGPLKEALQEAAANIKAYHDLQRSELRDKSVEIAGSQLGYRYQALDCAAVYVPGGKASYPSSVLMGLIPALAAGVPDCILITPPNESGSVDPAVLYCARLLGVMRVIKSGGAQGIAAAGFGLAGIRPDIIVGPGNRYVTAAKNLLAAQGLVRIDSPAGPSEVLVIADDSANPEWVAADMLSQAEHGADSPAILACLEQEFAQSVSQAIATGLEQRPRRGDWKRESIRNHSYAIVFDQLDQALEFANQYAAEHLEICTRSPQSDFAKIRHAGSVFLGHYAPVALGDYYSGTNHVLPTGGAARFYSGLGVDSFMKRISWQYPSADSLQRSRRAIGLISQHEGLDQEHGHSVEIRFQS